MGLISTLKKKNTKTLFTTPSHSGNLCIFHKFYQWYRNDISEVDAYEPQKALFEAEKKAAIIYGTKSTKFLTNGSSSGIIAAVLASCKAGDKLMIWKHAHKCHKNAGFLAGAEIVEYDLQYNEEWDIYEPLSASDYEKLILENRPKAIIITSPTYEGMVSDVVEISKICKKNNIFLIADEAHGALYPFSDKLPQSFVKYADFTIQSLHKTAGGINPTALLHTNTDLDINSALEKISTTSPSYPMLATIEANINFLNSSRGKKSIENLIKNIEDIKEKLNNIEFYVDDITKLLIKKTGISGEKLSEILYHRLGIEDEKTNKKSTLLITGLGTSQKKLSRLLKLNRIYDL